MNKLKDAFILVVSILGIVILISIQIGKPLVNTDYGNGHKVKSILITEN